MDDLKKIIFEGTIYALTPSNFSTEFIAVVVTKQRRVGYKKNPADCKSVARHVGTLGRLWHSQCVPRIPCAPRR
mgnify:CR=1 FL=1